MYSGAPRYRCTLRIVVSLTPAGAAIWPQVMGLLKAFLEISRLSRSAEDSGQPELRSKSFQNFVITFVLRREIKIHSPTLFDSVRGIYSFEIVELRSIVAMRYYQRTERFIEEEKTQEC